MTTRYWEDANFDEVLEFTGDYDKYEWGLVSNGSNWLVFPREKKIAEPFATKDEAIAYIKATEFRRKTDYKIPEVVENQLSLF